MIYKKLDRSLIRFFERELNKKVVETKKLLNEKGEFLHTDKNGLNYKVCMGHVNGKEVHAVLAYQLGEFKLLDLFTCVEELVAAV